MNARLVAVMLAACGAVSFAERSPGVVAAPDSTATALTGIVTSNEEGAMEGVLVSARTTASTQTVTVVSDEHGRYRFPAAKLQPGRYSLAIRAVGFDLDRDTTVSIASGASATADLRLQKAANPASQLTNAEWLASFPGSEQQKASVRGCAHCHTLELVARSRHDADAFVKVVERMAGYPPLAFPLVPQRTPAPRIGGGPVSAERQRQEWRRQAEYLGGLNLSGGPQWSYGFKTLPRPKGAATRVIYTEYALSPKTRQPHDVIVDSTGTVWYASFGEPILARLDPRTGRVVEYPVPILKPDAPKGTLGMRFDEDENLWLALQFQGGIAKFDRRTETFQTWSLPPELNGDHVQVNQVSPERQRVDGKVWLQDAGTYTVLRLDVRSGKFEVFEPYKIPRPNVYDVIPDSKNNGYFLPLGSEEIGRIDAKTGAIAMYKTPTPGSGPRRGMMDAQDRLWFGENRSDRIGLFDTRTNRFQEWPAPTPGAWPYDVTIDKDGDVWSGGEYNDRILRLNPKTGQFIEYLLPSHTNVRRVFVDNRTTPVTFWVGNNHGASIVKVEPLDGPVPDRVSPGDGCEALAHAALPNGRITMAQAVAPGEFTPPGASTRSQVFGALPSFCRIAATLTPSSDSDIRMEAWMPASNWNGKLQAVGNGAFNGTIGYAAMAAALARGYAASATDTGHVGGSGSFALGHPEKLIDFAWRAVHEMTVAAKQIAARHYGTAPTLSYWNGCSAGGRQALKEAQRFPDDFNGIIAGAPGLDWTGRAAQAVRVAKTLEKNASARLLQPQRALLHRAALEACDALDGAKDGLIEDPTRCRFDPGALLCKGSDADACLTAAQVETARLVYSPAVSRRTGRQIAGLQPGSELGWTDTGWSGSAQATGLDQFRFIVFGDPNWTLQRFDADADIARADDLDDGAINALDPNLKPFFDRGGKLIQYHGWSDPQISPGNSTAYYARVVAAVGDRERVEKSYRLFMAPGMGHCGGGEGPNDFDMLAALEQWVEHDEAPARIIASHSAGGRVDRTRPLCPYPQQAVYSGSGSLDDAASFACRTR
jgi:streptogramin lyase